MPLVLAHRRARGGRIAAVLGMRVVALWLPGMTRQEPCLLCGGMITADPADPSVAVLAHLRSDRHRLVGVRPTRTCPDCRMVTIPGWRDRCHGCSRARAQAAV